MMWDFGDHTYTPGQEQQRPRSAVYPPQQSPYPPAAHSPSPFMPVVQHTPSYSSSHSSAHSQYGMPLAAPSSYPSGGVPRSPVDIRVEYSNESSHVHRSRRHSHSHSHSHSPRPPQVVQQAPGHHGAQGHVAQPHPQQQHYAPLQMPSPHFEYSKCTGRKKALCIGVNYIGTQEQLSGCINDAHNVRNFLITHCGYRSEDIVLLTDDSRNPRQIPTRQNMIDGMKWLVRSAQKHDALFFHYSGHGSQVKDRDGDEVDGFDEVILPVDFRKAGIITDDVMHDIMVTPLPTGCRLTALFDSCHSGTALDLPYLYHTDGRLKGTRIARAHQQRKASSADVISFSGCKDSQTSADTVEDGVAAGAMSYAFIRSWRHNPNQTYKELLVSVRKILREHYSQKPQLSSSHKIDTNLKFIL
ncbi:caspase family protein [Phanerochaete sordida]|uniref:Caspase family protein n=1 Tax=Phanerochaete sordida TaxID=48140 RepID=A0A9P3GP88_9APHY|nr:caspase family protein [Phanerochaete sordida]